MEVLILPSGKEVCLRAARIIANLVRARRNAVLGLATGITPGPIYAELVRQHRQDGLSFRGVSTFNLDEYVGIDATHSCSYRRYMAEAFFDHVDVPAAQIHLPNGMAADVAGECDAYEAAIRKAGGIDLQLLGIGRDGHIGFNEPSSSLGSRTRIKTLSEVTRAANRGCAPAGEELPGHVITMGIATILEARRCVLVAVGAHKATAVAETVEGPLRAFFPSSALQLHPHATLLVDEAAAERLTLRDHYRSVAAAKPAWQRED
ncbi:MAG TPA: glucosamine-6-phosphate deaminase [Polyangia bacterium]|jgi:glucosamine-6-phosphate deaminase|nr:glucosamine-6-phosphate deaminase [Polyangia bacterium]